MTHTTPTQWLTAAFAALCLIVGAWTEARAHGEWYEYDCCSNRDCRPAQANELRFTPEGVLFVPTNRLFKWGDRYLRPSQDAESHVCLFTYGSEQNSARCVYYAIGG